VSNKCKNCGGLLDGIICSYCGARNEIDLKARYEVHKETQRVCPNCEVFLSTIMIDRAEEIYIEQCKHCKGIFLDFGELEVLMEHEIVKSEKRDLKKLHEIINNPLVREKKVIYKKCPECRKIMARYNYKQRSGVILDRCGSCGYWLDAGELRQIMEWAKVSGIRDFTPTLSEENTTSTLLQKTAQKSYTSHHSRYTIRDDENIFASVIDGFFRGLYGL
jgi:Zn-finger nucleic acid-binding protein